MQNKRRDYIPLHVNHRLFYTKSLPSLLSRRSTAAISYWLGSRMRPANKQFSYIIASIIAAAVLLLHIVTNHKTSSFYELSVPVDEFSDHCDLNNWHEVQGIYDPGFAEGLSEICRQVLKANTSILVQPRPLVRLQVIQHLGQKRPVLWKSYLQKVIDATRVKIVVATYDRPSALYNTLRVMDSLVSGASVSVLYDASTSDGLKAYASVLSEFPAVQAWNRREQGGYFAALQAVAQQDISHLLIAADDTTFIRPVNLAHIAALMMLLGDGERQEYRVSSQLRVSYPYPDNQNMGNIVGQLLLADEPYLFLADCCEHISNFQDPEFRSVCYDRHIDGPLYSIHQVRKEWALLVRQPEHPGKLEELWMYYKNERPNKADFSLFAADQVLVNSGMSFGTVRDDRKHLEAESFVAEQERLRTNEFQALLNGCRQEPLNHMQTFLMSRSCHVAEPSMEWHCPAQK